MFATAALFSLAVRGELVRVCQETFAGGVRTVISDGTLETSATYSTQDAPLLRGYIFTHWSISTEQDFDCRDRFGRAREAARYVLREETTLTANYIPEEQDSDGDGMADGLELYWYGDLSQDGVSDTDGDGWTFAEEMAAMTNPLLKDESAKGGIVWAQSGMVQYNPNGIPAYVVRSEPEGALFETATDFVEPGTAIPIPEFRSEKFAYWTVNGVRLANRFGRAKDNPTITMADESLEIVAVTEEDENKRNALYWYGMTEVDPSSDTDGDGWTFAEEMAAKTNPLLKDESAKGGIVWAQSGMVQYNPNGIPKYVVKSEPEGALFETATDFVEPGTAIPIPEFRSGKFAYWTVNGVRLADRLGRAKDNPTITMADESLEIVAVTEEDENRRNALYWYGMTEVDPSSDTDGDGWTFAEEMAAKTNPLLKDESAKGGIVWADVVVEGKVEIVADGWVLDAATAARIREICANIVKQNPSAVRLVVKGDSEIVPIISDLGISPALEPSGSDIIARYNVPTLRIVAFEPKTGLVRIKISPGEGNSICSTPASGCIRVYGTGALADKMQRIPDVAVDSAPYLKSETKGEAELSVDLGNHKFIKVKVEKAH